MAKQNMLITSLLMGDEHSALLHLPESNVNEEFLLPNGIRTTCLHLCAQKGFEHITVALLKSGANPTLYDGDGVLPIYYAIRKQYFNIVRIYMLCKQITADTLCHKPYRQTVMHAVAMSKSYHSVILAIMQKCGNTEIWDINSKTAAHYLVEHMPKHDTRLVRAYHEICKPDWNVKEIRGLTPLDFAIRNDNTMVVEFLLYVCQGINVSHHMIQQATSQQMKDLLNKYQERQH